MSESEIYKGFTDYIISYGNEVVVNSCKCEDLISAFRQNSSVILGIDGYFFKSDGHIVENIYDVADFSCLTANGFDELVKATARQASLFIGKKGISTESDGYCFTVADKHEV